MDTKKEAVLLQRLPKWRAPPYAEKWNLADTLATDAIKLQLFIIFIGHWKLQQAGVKTLENHNLSYLVHFLPKGSASNDSKSFD